MMAAIQAAENGAQVILLEKNEKLGKKLYITGKGRCNVTNACDRQGFFDHVVRNPRFLYSSYDAFSNWDMMSFLEKEGLVLKTERGDRVFPFSDKASDVTKTLQTAMERRKVRWVLHSEVKELLLDEVNPDSPEKKGKTQASMICRGVILSDGRRVEADSVIVAAGGLSYPSTGSTGDGCRFAEEAGHTVSAMYPSLVPFEAEIGKRIPCAALQGLALKNVGIEIRDGGKKLAEDFGELLFTHFGVSGPVILTASSLITERLNDGSGKKLELRIDLKPALTEEQLDARLQRELAAGANRRMKNLAGSLYPSSLIPVILQLADISPEKCGREVTREERARLLSVTKAFPVTLSGTRGLSEAIITRGGVSVREINPKTMESKLVRGLYFAGEVLDVDAFTGGFNLQIAWSTGAAAGRAAALAESP